MIPINGQFYPAFSIEDVLLDKDTGAPLSAGRVYFYEDNQRTVLKPVYQITGTSPNYEMIQLPNPIILSAIGTFEDSMGNPVIPYFFPYDDLENVQTYYIYVTNSQGTFQFARENQPYVSSEAPPPDQIINGDNELNNPQFVEVSFNPQNPCTYNFSAANNEFVQLAPDWSIVASGTGTVTVERIVLTEVNTPTNPPYVIDITSAGVSNLYINQRLTNSPRLVARGFLAGYFIAASEDSLPHALQMEYVPSGGSLASTVIIDQLITGDGSYNILQGNLNVTGTINPDPATTGYVDINIIIPAGAHVRVSSFQLVQVNAAVNIGFGEVSTPKQINTLFSYYKNSMQYMPKQSMVPWWKFGLNPLQFKNTGSPVVPQCSYIFDQTILYQAGAGSKVNVFIGPTESDGFLRIQAATGATDVRFALITYIAPQSIQGWWGYWLSTLARANLSTTLNTSVGVKVRVIWRATLPSTIGVSEPIASWAPGTDPTFSAGWTAITPVNDPSYTLGKNSYGADAGAQTFPAYPFDQMQLPIPAAAATNMIGLVFYTYDPLDSTSGSEDIVNIDSISLVPNQFAVDSTPMTFDQVKRATQLYVESTYPTGSYPGDINTINQVFALQRASDVPSAPGTSSGSLLTDGFPVKYQEKCIAPDITLYNPTTGNAGTVLASLYGNGTLQNSAELTVSTSFVQTQVGTSNATYLCEDSQAAVVYGSVAGSFLPSGNLTYHAFINSQLGQ